MKPSGLTPDLKRLAIEVFEEIDEDKNQLISPKESLKFWSNNFAKLNTQEFFKSVDKKHNQQIDQTEWIDFWVHLKTIGHTEDDIREELENIKNRRSWVDFSS
jgi:hypothetical protein